MADTTGNTNLEKEHALLEKKEKSLIKQYDLIKQIDSLEKEAKSCSEERRKELEKEIENLKRKLDLEEKSRKENKSALAQLILQNRELETQKTKVEKISDVFGGIKNIISSSANLLTDLTGVDFSGLVPTKAAKELISMERSTAKLGQRMGAGALGSEKMVKTYTELQRSLGASASDAKEIVETLSTNGYVANLDQAAKYASLYSRATGASNSQSVDMLNSLTKIGKFSSKEAGTMLANIAAIQKKNGITKQGIDAIAGSIQKTTINMKAFGQSDAAIKRMVESTAKLVSGLEKVGVSAETAVGWIERLTDPEKITENIGLYAQLGMSISDALSGNLDGDAIGEGLKDFGQKIKDMGPIAGSEYAKAFGMSYKEAIKAADLEPVEAETTTEEKSLQALEEMKEATLDMSAKMQESMNQLSGTMQGMFKDIGQFGIIAVAFIVRGFKSGIKDIFRTINEKEKEATKQAFIDENELFAKRLEDEKEATNYLHESSLKMQKNLNNARIAYSKGLIKVSDLKTLEKQADDFVKKFGKEIESTKDDFFNNTVEDLQKIENEINKELKKSTKVELIDAEKELKKLKKIEYEIEQGELDRAKRKLGMEEGASKEDMTAKITSIKEELEGAANVMSERLQEASEKIAEVYGTTSEVASESLRNAAADASGSLGTGARRARNDLRNAGRNLNRDIRKGANSAGGKLKSVGGWFKRTLSTAGKGLKSAGKAAGMAIKMGATAAKTAFMSLGIPILIGIALKLIGALDKVFGFTKTLGKIFDKLGVVGKVLKQLFDIDDEEEEKEAIEENTEALQESNENKKAALGVYENGKVGVKTAGSIVREDSYSENKTTNSSSQSDNKSGEIVAAANGSLQEQRITNNNLGQLIDVINKWYKEYNSSPFRNVAEKPEIKTAKEVDTNEN